MSVSLGVAAGRVPKGGDESGGETASGETGDPSGSSGGVSSTGAPTSGAPTTGAPTTATAGMTGTGTETAGETETGEPMVPAECSQPDPAASAAFQLELEPWGHDLLCVVDAIAEVANVVTTTMTCDAEGVPTPASLSFAVAPEGKVDWQTGAEVRLVPHRVTDYVPYTIVQLRAAADDALLAVAVAGGTEHDKVFIEAFLPLIYGLSEPCGPGDWEASVPAQVDIDDPDGGEIHLISMHRGSIEIDATHAYVVDVGEVVAGASGRNHFSQEVLLRRVVIDG